MFKYFVLTFMIFQTSLTHSKPHFFTGFNKVLKDTQDSNGKLEDKPFSPTLGFGYNFNLFDSGFGFSPQIGYIHTKQVANDSYGKQRVHTIFLNWDLIWISSLSNNLAFRFGVGNFIKRTKGEGGKVKIPNGSGTDYARRPGKTVSSYSSTFNIGADYNFDLQMLGWIEDIGLRFELYTFRPLSKEHRNYAFNIGALLYF